MKKKKNDKMGERIILMKPVRGVRFRWGTLKIPNWEVPTGEYEIIEDKGDIIRIAVADGKFVSSKHIYEISKDKAEIIPK